MKPPGIESESRPVERPWIVVSLGILGALLWGAAVYWWRGPRASQAIFTAVLATAAGAQAWFSLQLAEANARLTDLEARHAEWRQGDLRITDLDTFWYREDSGELDVILELTNVGEGLAVLEGAEYEEEDGEVEPLAPWEWDEEEEGRGEVLDAQTPIEKNHRRKIVVSIKDADTREGWIRIRLKCYRGRAGTIVFGSYPNPTSDRDKPFTVTCYEGVKANLLGSSRLGPIPDRWQNEEGRIARGR